MEGLEIAQEAERATAEKSTCTRRLKRSINPEIEGIEVRVLEDEPVDSEDNCITVVQRGK
jgi:hypothetical protein